MISLILVILTDLFPVSVGSLWSCGEPNPLVTFGELNVEESDESLKYLLSMEK